MSVIEELVQNTDLEACLLLIKGIDYCKSTLDCLFDHLKALFFAIISEKAVHDAGNFPILATSSLQAGPLLSSLMRSHLLDKIVSWSTSPSVPNTVQNQLQKALLRNFNFLISGARRDLLFFEEVVEPILQLLSKIETKEMAVAYELSRFLKSLCILVFQSSDLLTFTRQVSLKVTYQEFFIFSKLVPLVHVQGPAEDNARDALLLILSLSSENDDVAHYLTSSSDLCPVLTTGLSGLYFSLPRKLIFDDPVNGQVSHFPRPENNELHVSGVGWHRISKDEWIACEPLKHFLHTLDFCNVAFRKSHVSVRRYLLLYIYSGFLLPVLGSALHQSAIDEAVAATAYLELFVRRLTEPALIGLFLRFIITSEYDSFSVLTTLTNRIGANSTSSKPSDRINPSIGLVHSGTLIQVRNLRRGLHYSHLNSIFGHITLGSVGGVADFRQVVSTPKDTLVSLSLIQSSITFLRKCPTDEAYQLGMVTLSLLRTILCFNCEDVMFRLVFQYLNNVDVEAVFTGQKFPRVAVSPDVSSNHTDSFVAYSCSSSEQWFASAHKFLGLAFTSNASQSYCCPGGTVEPSNFCSGNQSMCLKPLCTEAYNRILAKTISTKKWCCDYSEGKTSGFESPKFPDNLHLPWQSNTVFQMRPTATELRPAKANVSSSMKAHLPSIVDKYRQDKLGSSVYKLSYLDTSSEEEIEAARPKSKCFSADNCALSAPAIDETIDAQSSPHAIGTRFPSPRYFLDWSDISPILEAIAGINARDDVAWSVSKFMTILDCMQTPRELDQLPYPPFDPFYMELIESRLSMKISDMTTCTNSSTINGDEKAIDEVASSTSSETTFSCDGLQELPLISAEDPPSRACCFTGGLGPFLNALLSRLASLSRNCLYTNLLLTEVILILLSFPQFPLAEILLNCSVYQMKAPGRAIYQVLAVVRTELHKSLSQIENGHALVRQALQYLELAGTSSEQMENQFPVVATEEDLQIITTEPTAAKHPPSVIDVAAHERRTTSAAAVAAHQAIPPKYLEPVAPRWIPRKLSPQPSLPSSRSRRVSVDRFSRFLHVPGTYSPQPVGRNRSCFRPTTTAASVTNATVDTCTRNIVYGYIVFNEFCRELAGLCIEHGVFHGSLLPKLKRTLSLENCLASI